MLKLRYGRYPYSLLYMVCLLKIITAFFTEGGPVCLESKAAEIRNCQVTKLSRLAVEDSNNISWTVRVFTRRMITPTCHYLYSLYTVKKLNIIIVITFLLLLDTHTYNKGKQYIYI